MSRLDTVAGCNHTLGEFHCGRQHRAFHLVRIDVLVVADRPNHTIAVSRLHDASKAAAVTDAVVVEQVVPDTDEAAAVGMHCSPTILIDGSDPFVQAGTPASMSCRLYRNDGKFDGVPSVTDLIAALRSA